MTLNTCPILPDSDKLQVETCASSLLHAATIKEMQFQPRQLCNGEGAASSVPKEKSDTIFGGRDWHSPSPEGFSQAGLVWRMLVQMRDRLEDLPSAWLSQLASPGMVNGQARDAKLCGLVVPVSEFGIIAATLQRRKAANGLHHFVLQNKPATEWLQLIVVDPSDWLACHVRAVAPRRSATLPVSSSNSDAPMAKQIVFERLRKTSLLEHAARAALPLDGGRPARVGGVCFCLLHRCAGPLFDRVGHGSLVLPDLSEEEVEAIVKSKNEKKYVLGGAQRLGHRRELGPSRGLLGRLRQGGCEEVGFEGEQEGQYAEAGSRSACRGR